MTVSAQMSPSEWIARESRDAAGQWAYWLVLASLLPIGLVPGSPLSLYHAVAIPLAAIGLGIAGRVAVAAVVWSSAAFAIGLYGAVAMFGASLAPVWSAVHFIAPYLVLAGAAAVPDRDRLLRAMVGLSSVLTAVTWLTTIVSGRPTLSVDGGRRFVLGQVIPIFVADAQVNNWGSILVAGALASALVLWKPVAVSMRTKFVAILNSIAVAGVIAISGSRTTTFVAGLIASVVVLQVARGRVQLARRHRTLLSLFVALLLLPLLAMTLQSTLGNVRVRATLEAVQEGDYDQPFAGRDERLLAMAEDIMRDPLLGTSFRGFAVRHPEFADSSPHNQWVGAAHKVGVPMAIVYLVGVIWLVRRGVYGWRWLALAVVFVLGATYDVLTAPVSGVWLLLVLLAGARTEELDRVSPVSDLPAC